MTNATHKFHDVRSQIQKCGERTPDRQGMHGTYSHIFPAHDSPSWQSTHPMGMIPGVNHFATAPTTTIWQNHDKSMGFKELRRASPCSSLRQLYIESQHGNCGDRYTPTLRRVKSFYNPPKDFALVFAMSFLNHKDSMVEVKIDTSNFVITVEVPLRIHNPYQSVPMGKILETEELECPECGREFMGEYGVEDLAWHFNNVHWKRRVERKKCLSMG